MSVFEDVLAVGLQAGLSITATSLTYTRMGFDPVPLNGTQGKSSFKIQEPGQPVTVVESVDFLIEVANLEIDGSPVKPELSDRISREIGSTKYTYKVLPMGDEIPLFEYVDDGAKTVYRIHTKLDNEEPI